MSDFFPINEEDYYFFGVSVKKSFFGKKILVKIFTLFVILNFNIFAETYTWNGSVSSDWGDAGNWESDDGVTFPGNGSNTDNVIIPDNVANVPDLSPSYTTFDYFSVGENVEINLVENLTVTTSLENSGTINCGTYSINSGKITNNTNGKISLTSGTISVSGEVTNAGTISNNSGSTSFSRAVTNNGTITCGSGALVVEGNYSGSGELTLSSGTSTFNGGTVDFYDVTLNHNNGTIVFDRASTGGMFSSDATINLKVNNTTFNNVKFGDTNNVKMTVDGNLIVEGDFTATSPTNFIGTEQTSTYKNITFSGSNKTISFAGKNTFANVNITGSNNTVTFSSENTFTELNISGEASIVALASANTIGTLQRMC